MLPVMLSQRLSVVFFREDTAPRPGMPGRRPQIFEPAGRATSHPVTAPFTGPLKFEAPSLSLALPEVEC